MQNNHSDPVSLTFCQVSEDKDLAEYPTLEHLLSAEFYPGNYTPTQDQAKQLIKAAAISAIRWARLHNCTN